MHVYSTCMYIVVALYCHDRYFRRSGLNFSYSEHEHAGVVAPQLMSHLQLSLPPLTHTGIDVWVLVGSAMNNLCTKKVLWAGRQFWDKSNKMVKSTASSTIYLSGSWDIVFRSGRTVPQSPQRSGLYWNFDSVFQSCHFLKTVCNKGDGLLRRNWGREGEKYKKVLLEREKRGRWNQSVLCDLTSKDA